MQLRNGQNTISDARFEAAADRLWEAHDGDTWLAAAGQTEELPSETSARHGREWSRLERDRNTLSIQEWLKHYPDPSQLQAAREAVQPDSVADVRNIVGRFRAEQPDQASERSFVESFVDRTIARGRALEASQNREQEPQQRQQEQ